MRRRFNDGWNCSICAQAVTMFSNCAMLEKKNFSKLWHSLEWPVNHSMLEDCRRPSRSGWQIPVSLSPQSRYSNLNITLFAKIFSFSHFSPLPVLQPRKKYQLIWKKHVTYLKIEQKAWAQSLKQNVTHFSINWTTFLYHPNFDIPFK